MKNTRGFIFLPIILILAAVGAGAVVTYQVAENSSEPNLIKSAVDKVENSFFKPVNLVAPDEVEKSEIDPNVENCPKPNTWVYVITQSQINDYLKKGMSRLEYANYKMEGGEVKMGNNSLTATINLNNKKSIFLTLKLNADGRDFVVEEIRSVGENTLSSLELTAIKFALNNADKIVWSYVDPYYKESFKNVSIHENYKMDVAFYTSEYLNCVNKRD